MWTYVGGVDATVFARIVRSNTAKEWDGSFRRKKVRINVLVLAHLKIYTLGSLAAVARR
jgi:hypothetical protein